MSPVVNAPERPQSTGDVVVDRNFQRIFQMLAELRETIRLLDERVKKLESA